MSPRVQARLDRGHHFNAYEMAEGGILIGIGPVSDCVGLASCTDPAVADMIVDALRAQNGQPPSKAPLSGGGRS